MTDPNADRNQKSWFQLTQDEFSKLSKEEQDMIFKFAILRMSTNIDYIERTLSDILGRLRHIG